MKRDLKVKKGWMNEIEYGRENVGRKIMENKGDRIQSRRGSTTVVKLNK